MNNPRQLEAYDGESSWFKEHRRSFWASSDKTDKTSIKCFANYPALLYNKFPSHPNLPVIPCHYHHHRVIVHFRPASYSSKSSVGLPLACILDALGYRSSAVFNSGADVGDPVPQGPAEAARGARHCLSKAARGRADDPADCVCKTADRIAKGRGDHLARAGDARVLVLAVHGGGWLGCWVWCQYVVRVVGFNDCLPMGVRGTPYFPRGVLPGFIC